jgi:beta-glucosidase/6-phospho-beta-glucosidase/beta-galactosidase
MNETTFFGYMAGEWAWAAPFGRDRETRRRLTVAMARADIAAVRAIRDIIPDARMIHIDPLIHVVPPRDRPDLAEAAHAEAYDDANLAFDVVAGLRHPELGGSPDILDIVGLNNYSFGQMEYRESGPHAALAPGDPRIRPLCDLIEEAANRYRRPVIVAETSGLGGGRADWLNDVVCECLAAVNRGVDLHGVCLFPAVDMPDWHSGEWVKNGIADVERLPDGSLMRVPNAAYVEALHRWQRRLNRVTRLDEDPFDRAVELEDIVQAARELAPAADANWS